MEIDNLRTLVTGVQEELCFLHELKDENIKLRAELRDDIYKHVSNAEQEINHLNSQLEIYKDYKFKVIFSGTKILYPFFKIIIYFLIIGIDNE